ncbi:hypothetical protein CAC42_1811 [Sphaceloma murrayae]|uniref:Uncharacterized protein n=1 Tax=Sphaceloma murrayae TaxID=2082308 RepID=A0A2K1QVJ4_9PEZI|nr:hypothetical protein CAC42_1811 [Sphaceloma murrayae]
MADGLNQIRAMRVAEIMQDFRNAQTYMAGIRLQVPRQDANLEGYLVLRQCLSEAQQLTNQPYTATSSNPRGDAEREKAQLRQIIMDASLRRFKAQKLFMRVVACQRWIAARNALLKGGIARAEHTRALAQITHAFRTEMGTITDARVEHTLRAADTAQGKWLAEDPSLTIMLQMLRPGTR